MKRSSAYAVLASELEAFRLLPWPVLLEHVSADPISKTVDVEGEQLQLEIQVSKAMARQQAVKVAAVAFGPSHLQMERLEESVTLAKTGTVQAPWRPPTTSAIAMPRPLSAAREREFQELYAFVDFYSTHVIKPLANSPKMADVCVDIIKQYGRSKALEGLRMATNDILEELGRIPSVQVESLDESFRRAGLVCLSELRRRYSSSFKRIVKRGRIQDDTEYYLLNGIVVDQSNDIDATERASLQRLLDTYEHAVAPKS